MATRQSHLRQQVETLREENQRLDKLVRDRQQKAGASPAEKASRTPQVDRSQSQTPQDLGAARKEIAQLRGQVQQLQQDAQAIQEELETVCQREGDTAERLLQCQATAERNAEMWTLQLDQCRVEKQTVERNAELLTAQFAELWQGRKTADERATAAEEEIRRLASALSRQKDEAELQNYRALAAQQEKWEAREKRLEQQLLARGECLEAELQERQQRQEGPEGYTAEQTGRAHRLETVGDQSCPPPLIRCPEFVSPKARGEQLSRESHLCNLHIL